MSQAPTNVTQVTPAKKKRTRTAGPPKPAFVILQMLDESGQPSQIDKKRIKIVAVERSAEKVMEAMEDGTHTNAVYLRIVLPASQRPQQKTAGKDAPAAA